MLKRSIVGFLYAFAFTFMIVQSWPWILATVTLLHLVAQYEFCALLGNPRRSTVVVHCLFSTVVMVFVALALHGDLEARSIPAVFLAIVTAYAIYFVWQSERHREQYDRWVMLRGLVLLTLSYSLFAHVAAYDGAFPYMLLLISSSWVADTAAIVAGKTMGRTPLAPAISPKKTVEGALGGVLAAGVGWMMAWLIWPHDGAMVDFMAVNGLRPYALPLLFVTGALIAVVGIFGDLTFSLFKRKAGLKDYGKAMPGHGGWLDRFDSMVLVTPFIWLLTYGM
ncbi:phosphatidate cytidylyltransferase [bacterium]|nr:phosphatidate cytidylyltransferase [bacterium]MCB1222113.1 phosphatidate cytidylyltransferase [bacterium]UNM09872.1 MAG: phosphatidate cytidylyltransferase [Planctomycetales bacterium]